MDCRIVTETELPQVMALWDYCFEKKDEPFYQWYFQEYCLQHNLVVGGFSEDDGHLQNMMHLNPYSILLRGQEERVPYIVGVATDPADRGRHLTEELLQSAFRLLRRKGCAFALLMPSGNLWLRHYSSLEKELFEGLYAALAEGYNGLPIRTDFQWRKLLAVHQLEKMQAAVVYHGSEPRGYMFYHIEDKTFFIQELVALTPDAKWALLRYAGEHQSSAKKFYWEAMEDDYTWLDFPEADRAGRVKPFMMARCFDAVQASRRAGYPVAAGRTAEGK